MREMFVSIIVPVYNVEQYLKECIESILAQTWKNFEVILVDDGSTDSSGKICDEYSQKKEFISVIHKKNGGLSSARNAGIDVAQGDYLAFIDSDDVVHPRYLSELVAIVKKEKADLAACNFCVGSLCRWKNFSEVKYDIRCNEDVLKKMNDNDVVVTVAWNKLYHAKFFREYGLRYPVGKIHEDMFLTPQILYYTKKMVITNEQLYFYRQRENSIMNSSFSIKQLDALDAIEFRIELFQHWNKQYLQASEYESYIRKSNELYKKMKEEETDLYIEAQERIKTKMKDFRNKKSIFNMLSWKYRIKLMAFLIMER
ncbi:MULTISPECIES: glycosyltransferase family 2 protein [Lachnospiraceae]|nr:MULTISPECIES: glycosyltransferase [Coprococcus]